MRAVVIGAGLSGLVCASALGREAKVRILEKSRGVGGRMATRRIDTLEGVASFDHGAQYFTARDPEFQETVADWCGAGCAAPWPAAGADAYVGAPAMNAPAKRLARNLDIAFGFEVADFVREEGRWRVRSTDGRAEEGDVLILAAPAEQAERLLRPLGHPFAAAAHAAPSEPCWTLMAAFATPLAVAVDCLRLEGALSWAARNSAKPGRSGPEAWVAQASPSWSADNLERTAEAVAGDLLEAFGAVAGALPGVLTGSAHRWRFARSSRGGPGRLWDPQLRLAVCGDWLLGPRVEAAFVSGRRAAADVLSG